MDPRLKGLIEVRDLLKAEGWAVEDDLETNPPNVPIRLPSRRSNPFLMVLCLAAVATNFILIGVNRDLRSAKRAMIEVRSMKIEGSEPGEERNFLRFFITIDGKKAYDLGDRKVVKKVGSDFSFTFPKYLNTFEDQSLLQLWYRSDEGNPILLGQSTLSLPSADVTDLEIAFEREGKLFEGRKFSISVNILRSRSRDLAHSR